MADSFEGEFRPLYRGKTAVKHKIRTIAREIYGAKDVEFTKRARGHLSRIDDLGYTHLLIDPNMLSRWERDGWADPALRAQDIMSAADTQGTVIHRSPGGAVIVQMK